MLIKKHFISLQSQQRRGCGEMVDTLVSGASASRRVGSTPIIRTKGRLNFSLPFLYSFGLCVLETTFAVRCSRTALSDRFTSFNDNEYWCVKIKSIFVVT